MIKTAQLSTITLLCIFLSATTAGLSDYLQSVQNYFGYDHQTHPNTDLAGFDTSIPYEVAEADEKFISQAMELTGISPSALDACQYRLILKLQSDCHTMNDMTISKLAVGLLNCQSHIEGRKVYPCTEEMSLKACTSEMNPDIWTSYHLMTNRAKAVCYSIRQAQFRGLTEHTVNSLMQAAKQQLNSLSKIAADQDSLQSVARSTLDSINIGHAELAQQQKDLHQAQLFGQMQLEDNIGKLADEKKMIVDAQKRIAHMTQTVQEKLNDAAHQIERQSEDTHSNHKEILEDLLAIQQKTQSIFQRIEESTMLLMKQTEMANQQYEMTLLQLEAMNKTVHSLVQLVGGTKQALEERLAWLITALGGTDDAIERVYLIVWHCLLLLIGMIACAFISASLSTRLMVIGLIPANLAMSLGKFEHSADCLTLAGILLGCIALESVASFAWKCNGRRLKQQMLSVPFNNDSIRSSTPSGSMSAINAEVSMITGSKTENYSRQSSRLADISCATSTTLDFGQDELFAVTPARSRNNIRNISSRISNLNGSFGGNCVAITRLGTPCRNRVTNGRDYCYRHQKGDSVMW